MKLKGINPIEQHAEKAVLALVALAGLGALVLQFLPGGNLVKVGNERVPAGQAFTPVAREAQALLSRMDSAEPRTPEVPSFTLTEKLALGAPGPAAPVVALGTAPKIGSGTISTVLASGMYALPTIPAPSAPVAAAYSATVHPAEKIRTPELAAILPPQQPFDLSAVSLEFTFDGASLRAALERDPDDAGPLEPIPLTWWRDTGGGGDQVLILAVEVERELVRDAEGRTPPAGTKPQIVPAMPGRGSALASWTESVRSVGDVPSALDAVRFRTPDIERPRFYATIAGPEWRAPSVVLAEGDPLEKQRQVRLLRDQLTRRQAQLNDLEDRLQRSGAAEPRRDDRRTEAPSPGRGRPGGGGGGPAPTTQPRTEQPAGDRRQLELAVTRVRREVDGIAQRLIALGETVDGYDAVAQGAEGEDMREPAPLLENPDLRLWAHDVLPEPGATYRYRARVVMNNPLFDRNLQESQRALGAESVLRGAWSEWSAPVTTDPRQVVFVVSAEDRSAISPRPRATAEVYEFFYGYYRKASVGLEPGDMVLGSARLPELRVADMGRLQETLTTGPGAASPGPITRAPETPRSPRSPTGPAAPVAPAPGGRAPAGTTGTPTDTPQTWPEWMSVELPRTLDFEVDAQLLDVLAVSAEGRQRTQVVLRRSDGTLATRLPDVERASPLLRRLEASEQAGQTQGREPVRADTPVIPLPGRRETEGPSPRPGRSGGGG